MLRRHLAGIPLAAVLGLGLLPSVAQAAPGAATSGLAQSAVTTSVAKPAASVVRVATFNVRTARATGDKRNWLKRAPDVARTILSRSPGVVALQELGPGRADGRTGTLKGHVRQTISLTNSLQKLGGGRYKLVRTTAYVAPGTAHGTQGARILYDSTRFQLVSHCAETTGKRNYNMACAFDLPIASGDSRKLRRSAAYAELADRRTGRHFFVVSAHLDPRHSGSSKTEAKYNRLRSAQATTVANAMLRVNPKGRPVVFGGDINSWQTDRGNYAPHRVLVSRGYVDATSAGERINYAYATINHFSTTLSKSRSGAGVRLDVLMLKNGRGFTRYENVMAARDSSRPSDHNMGLADILL